MSVDLNIKYVDNGNGVEGSNENFAIEDVEVIDNDEWDSFGEDIDDKRMKVILKQLVKENRCSRGEVHTFTFQVGQKYKYKNEINDKFNKLSIESGTNLSLRKMTK